MDKVNLWRPVSQTLRNLRRLLALAWKVDKKVTAGYYLTAGLSAFISALSTVAMKYVIDNLVAIQTSPSGQAVGVVLIVLGASFLIELIDKVTRWGLNGAYFDYLFRYKLQNHFTYSFYEKLSGLDIGHFENSQTQTLIAKTKDTMTWRPPDFLRELSYFFYSATSYLSAFMILASFSLWIPVLITVVNLPFLYLRAKFGSAQWSIYGSGAPEAKKLWYFMWILSTPQAVREMRIFGAKDALLGRFKKIQEHLLALNKQPLDNYVRFLTFPSLFEAVTLFFVAVFNLPAVLSGVMTVGSFTLLINMVYRLSYDTGSMVITFGDMYAASLYVDHYFEVMELPRLVSEPPNPVIFKKVLPPKIEFRDVYFSYPNTNKEVLNSVSFTINPGENAAFVGENGAGKSTIVKLLCRFYDPTKGEILINDVNLKELSLPNWYEFLGTLFQDFVQYHFSVTDNITFGNPYKFDPSTRATVDSRGLAQDSAPRINREEPDSAAGLHDKAVCEAARKAGATEFIEKLPKGFSTMLGREFEEGEELSIGQWQKLAIARAFYEEAPVLILDEPTSAIDAEGEYEIFRNLQKAYSSKTLILVSHRFSTVRRADKIFVVEAGKIAEEGKHEELIKLDGKYAKMFKTQAKGYE